MTNRAPQYVLLAGLILVSCQSSIREIATPVPTPAHAKASGKPLETLVRGRGIYMRQCAQCHEHRLPNTATFPEWHAKIETMSELAGLPASEQKDLQVYLGEFSDR